MTTITRAVTVAAGVFAPGHLGELTQYLPFELVDDVLEQARTVQRRLRDLPSRVGVYFVLALGMYPRLGYARVRAKLTAGLEGLPVPCPSEKALRDLRDGIAYCESVRDFVSRDLLLGILASEEDHVDFLDRQFDLIKQIGIERYILLNAAPAPDQE